MAENEVGLIAQLFSMRFAIQYFNWQSWRALTAAATTRKLYRGYTLISNLGYFEL